MHGNLVPGRVKEMIRFYNEGDVDGARAIDEELAPLVDALEVTINPIAIKAALNLLGHEVGGLRLPLVEATPMRSTGLRSAWSASARSSRPERRRAAPARRAHCFRLLRCPASRLAANETLRIIPLGGLGEVGKNMTVFESGDEDRVVDAGLAFPRDEHLGVDLVLPDFSYLRTRERVGRSC